MSALRHILIVAALIAAAALCQARTAMAAEGDKPGERTVSVSATGSVGADPDMATISTGVIVEAETAKDALARNSTVMAKLIDGIKGLGIAPKDIQTTAVNVEPRYVQAKDGRPASISGYRVVNQVRLTVREVKRLGEILDAAITLGANQVNGIGFDVSNAETLKDEARKQAMVNAKRRAELYATAAGAQLGNVLSISEEVQGGPRPMPLARSAMAGAVPIEAGTRTLTVEVHVTYASSAFASAMLSRHQEPVGAPMLNLSFHDPRIVGSLMLACAALTAILIPTFFLEVVLTVALSAVLAPGITSLRKRLRLGSGITVAGIALLVLVFLGIAGYYGVPILIRGINETLSQLPDGIRTLLPFVQEWLEQMKARLEDLFPGDTTFDDFLRKNLPEIAGQGGVVRFVLAAIFGSVASLGQFLLFLVLTAILSGEWDKNVEKAHYLLSLFAPRQLPHLLRFGQKFQRYGIELFLAIGTVMAIFMPIFFALLFFYGKLSLGKSVLFGAILGFTSAIPTIGGIITYLILVVVGVLNFGLSYDGVKTTAVMYVVAFVVHFAETKLVTPRVLGHRIAFTSFAIITVLVASVLTFGIGRGILTGLFLLVAFKALVEVADEGRQARGAPEPAGVVVGSQPAPVTLTPAAPSAASAGAAGLGTRPHSKRGRRRGRG